MSGPEKRQVGSAEYRVVQRSGEVPVSDLASSPVTFVVQESIGYLLAVNARILQREMTARLSAIGVAHSHWSIMLALWAGDGITQRELSRRVAIEEPTLARALSGMEKEGLVKRQRDPVDARQVLVSLTDRSVRLRDELIPVALSVQEHTTAALTDAEKMILITLLRKVFEANRAGG